MPVLHLNKDGSIIVAEHGQPDRPLDPADPLDLLSQIRSLPEFEDGLTVGEMVSCLRPWSAVLSRMGWLDFDAWDAAIKAAPAVRDACDPFFSAEEPPVAAIVISPVLTERIDKKGNMTLLTRWDSHGEYAWPCVNAETGHQDLYCSLSFLPPSEMASLPIRIDDRAWINTQDFRHKGRRILAHGIESTGGTPSMLRGPACFFDTVVLGFLDDISFHGDPEETKDVGEHLASLVAEIKAGRIPEGSRTTVIDLEGDIEGEDEDGETRH